MTATVTKLSNDQTQAIWQADRDHFTHPWTHFDSFKKEGSLVIDRATGPYVFDTHGKRYLDGIGGIWCVNIGYGRDEMVEAIAEQARRLPFFNAFVDTTNAPAALLAKKLAEIAPKGLTHTIFTCTGSDSNDSAVRLSHFYWARKGQKSKRHIIARHDSYHGSTYLGMALTGRAADKSPYFNFDLPFVHHISSPYTYRRPDGMTPEQFTDHLVREFEEKILELGAENIAAYIAEPILGAGGVIVPPPGYNKRMYEMTRKYDILYISDEVVAAFGRVGEWFATEKHFGFAPDIITTAKGISSGYVPLGATIYSDAIHEVISAPGDDVWFTHGFTYSGHPVSCIAGLKNIEIMEREGILDHVRKMGPYFQKRLEGLLDLPLVGDVRGSHFMLCVENVAKKETKELVGDEANVGKRISNHCEAMGLIVRPLGHLNIISPPLTLSKDEIDFLVDTLAKGIKMTTDDLVREGHKVG